MAARGGGRGPRRGPGGLEAENKFKVSYDPKPTYPVSQQKHCHDNLIFFFFARLHASSLFPSFTIAPSSTVHRTFLRPSHLSHPSSNGPSSCLETKQESSPVSRRNNQHGRRVTFPRHLGQLPHRFRRSQCIRSECRFSAFG